MKITLELYPGLQMRDVQTGERKSHHSVKIDVEGIRSLTACEALSFSRELSKLLRRLEDQ